MTKNLLVTFGCIVVFIVLFVIGSAIQAKVNPVASTHSADRSDACSMSQNFVKDNLKAPATAKFPMWTQENCTATHTGNNWTVTSFVDAQNGFGALIRSDYTVRMTYHPERDTWTLTGLTIDAR